MRGICFLWRPFCRSDLKPRIIWIICERIWESRKPVGRSDAMSDSKDFSVPDLAPADRKIQNDRQRKQIPRFGKVRYLFFNIMQFNRMWEPHCVKIYRPGGAPIVNKISLMKPILMQSRSDLELGIQTFSLKLCKFVHECNSCTCIIDVWSDRRRRVYI